MAEIERTLRGICSDPDERVLVELAGNPPGRSRRRGIHLLTFIAVTTTTILFLLGLTDNNLWATGGGTLLANLALSAWFAFGDPWRGEIGVTRALVVSTHRVVLGETHPDEAAASISQYPLTSQIELLVRADSPKWSSGRATVVELAPPHSTRLPVCLDGTRPASVRQALRPGSNVDVAGYHDGEPRTFWVAGWTGVFISACLALLSFSVAIEESGATRGLATMIGLAAIGAIGLLIRFVTTAPRETTSGPDPDCFRISADDLNLNAPPIRFHSEPAEELRWNLRLAGAAISLLFFLSAAPREETPTGSTDAGFVCLRPFPEGLRAVFYSPEELQALEINPELCDYVDPGN